MNIKLVTKLGQKAYEECVYSVLFLPGSDALGFHYLEEINCISSENASDRDMFCYIHLW